MSPMADSPRRIIRRTVFFSGRVQGVGFRFEVHSLASRCDLTGFVRNLSDGRVEFVAEGHIDEIDGLLTRLGDAMVGHIESVETHYSEPTGEYSSFDVTY